MSVLAELLPRTQWIPGLLYRVPSMTLGYGEGGCHAWVLAQLRILVPGWGWSTWSLKADVKHFSSDLEVKDDYRNVENDRRMTLGVHTSLAQAVSILPCLFLYRLSQMSITLQSTIARTLEIRQHRHDATLLSSYASHMLRR